MFRSMEFNWWKKSQVSQKQQLKMKLWAEFLLSSQDIGGEWAFGLASPTITRAIESLEHAFDCNGYIPFDERENIFDISNSEQVNILLK